MAPDPSLDDRRRAQVQRVVDYLAVPGGFAMVAERGVGCVASSGDAIDDHDEELFVCVERLGPGGEVPADVGHRIETRAIGARFVVAFAPPALARCSGWGARLERALGLLRGILAANEGAFVPPHGAGGRGGAPASAAVWAAGSLRQTEVRGRRGRRA